MTIPTSPLRAVLPRPRHLHSIIEDCEELGNTKPGDTHKMAGLLLQMNLRYYSDVRNQAQQSFWSALGAAVVGTLFFIYAAWLGMRPSSDIAQANVSAIAGALVQIISAINFYLYGRAARQFASFHICLERTNRFLLANTLCEALEPPLRNQLRAELVRIVAHAPMLTLDIVEGRQPGQQGPPVLAGPDAPQSSEGPVDVQ